jgi:hypothetical protein
MLNRYTLTLFLFFFVFAAHAIELQGKWLATVNGSPAKTIIPQKDGTVSTTVRFPGSALVYLRRDRTKLRPVKAEFSKDRLAIEVKIASNNTSPVSGYLFVTDKDGVWFQSRKEFRITPNRWEKLEVRLPASANELRGEGHNAAWDSNYAVNIQIAGLSLFGRQHRDMQVMLRAPRLEGERTRPELIVRDWQVPKECEKYQMIQSNFELSREYFNPFDPDEIKLDVEAISPSGKKYRWPAFYTREYVRDRHYTREIIEPSGKAHWAFRITPPETGEWRVRLVIDDKSEKKAQQLMTHWRKINVLPSKRPGFIRIAPDRRYFQRTTGEFFFPVGLNIHSNIDLRSERSFKFGHLPDRGVYDYEDYFTRMGESGMNACEVWMASWTFAVEWSSSCKNFYGLGRYNLANAWKLDYLIEFALKKGINLHLVLDNHGKLSEKNDQEWEYNPFNAKDNPFAVADGAFIKDIKEFFTSEKAMEYNRKRNRYIAARWGACTNIMVFEFWSEVGLCTGFKELYDNGKGLDWHRRAAKEMKQYCFAKHLVTTHYCGDFNRNFMFRELCDMPEMEVVVGDAYRDTNLPFYAYMKMHRDAMKVFDKPKLITEFGGTHLGAEGNRIVADIHAGLWSSFFIGQSGAPFLWWHDFVHLNDHYQHYAGFAKYMRGINPVNKNFYYYDFPIVTQQDTKVSLGGMLPERIPMQFNPTRRRQPEYRDFPWQMNNVLTPSASRVPFLRPNHWEYPFGCLAAGNELELYGWAFCKPYVYEYPEKTDELKPFKDMQMVVTAPMETGKYSIEFFDTLTNKLLARQQVSHNGKNLLVIKLPPFKIDLAFKMKKLVK